MRNHYPYTMAQTTKSDLKPNELLLAAVGQIMMRNPSASEDLVRTTLYNKHPEAARLLAVTPSHEHEARIVKTAIKVHRQKAERQRQQTGTSANRRAVWIG